MEAWFFQNPERLKQERAGIEGLRATAGWLVAADWNFEVIADEVWLCLDAVIGVHGHDYEVRLSYPPFFPESPLVICPRNATRRWSGHQYGGANGALCLEYGPDNWQPEVTGVHMLESAHRLLEAENPLGNPEADLPPPVLSRHCLTIGQELRGKVARWYASKGFYAFLGGQPIGVGSFKFSFQNRGDYFVALMHQAAVLDGEPWTDDQIPEGIPGTATTDLLGGIWFRAPHCDAETIDSAEGIEAMRALLEQSGHPPDLLAMDGTSSIPGLSRHFLGILVLDKDGNPHFFVGPSKEKITRGMAIQSASDAADQTRIPTDDYLGGKRIGIVGLGSAGSKIAETLARTGARDFYLVDHDVFLPGNLVRNALDWRAVGEHKVDGVASSLRFIATGMQIQVSRNHLTGQESNAVLNATLQELGGCDIIIDATADAQVLNLLAAVVRTAKKPLVWFEVFAGGIGGMIARCRPDLDPSPQQMRGALLTYCQEQGVPAPPQTARRYEAQDDQGTVLSASDMDVALIAHHAARLAVDTILTSTTSRYPSSMYLIGLAKAWLFQAPFDVIPIHIAKPPEASTADENHQEITQESLAFFAELVKKRTDETSASS